MKSRFATWFEKKFLNWQTEQGGRRTIEDFADFLGVKRSTVGLWMNDQRRPGLDNVDLLATRLEDLEVYDTLDLPRPDELLFKVKVRWPQFTDKEKAAIGKILKEAELKDAAGAAGEKSAAAPKRSM